MKEKNNNSKTSSRVGRPLVYPDIDKMAVKLINLISTSEDNLNKSFDVSGWKVERTMRKALVHGRHLIHDKNDNIIEMIPFRIMFPRFDMNPVENLTIKFSNDDHSKYLRKRFKKKTGYSLHENIKGLLYHEIEKLKA